MKKITFIGDVHGKLEQYKKIIDNISNKFWVDMAGKTYKPNEVVWLNDSEFLK